MNALQKTLRHCRPSSVIGSCVLPILAAAAMFASPQGAFAGANTNLPFTDDFEGYTNGTLLNTGTNGWFGDSSNIIVQTTTVRSGTNAAIIPVDCTLSNRFQSIAVTNVWIQMDVRPSLYDGTNNPVVDTNQAAMFYINSNGTFVVHNGLATNTGGTNDPTNSANWVIVTTAASIPTNVATWVRVNVYENFAQTNWDLYADGVLVTNNIGFVNTALTNFSGFGVYNGAATSYLDNVSVTAIATNEATQRPLIVIPPTPLVRSYFTGETPSVQTVKVYNVWSDPIGFQITTNQPWVSASPTNGSVAAGTTNDVTLTYVPMTSWQGGVSNATVTVVATNGTARWDTQTVALVMNIMDLQVTPTNMTNAAWVGETPTNQTFIVQNAGGGSFTYATATGAFWITCSSTGGPLGANSSNTLTLSYANTAGWAAGSSNTTVTISSSDSGGTSRTVSVTLNVSNVQASMSVSPTLLSNVVWVGGTPTNNRTFAIINAGGSPLNFTATPTSDCPWITGVAVTPGTVAANGSNVMTVSYGNTVGWQAGDSSNASITVVSTNGGGATQVVSVILSVTNIASLLDVAPANLTNGVVVNNTPPSQSFNVLNLGDADFTYGVVTGVPWLTSSTTGGLLIARGTSTVTLTYANTTGWTPGTTSNGTVTVSSADGGVASEEVGVTLYIYRSGITNTIPFSDDFEQYTNLTPLVSGINGWYGSSTGIIAQQSVKSNGLQAAMIPVDCTLSNPFVVGVPGNVRVTMDLRLVRSDYAETNFPAVDTNSTFMFYVDTNGHFVVCSGSGTTSTWNMVSNAVGGGEFVVTNDTWTHVVMYLDYRHRNWKLKANNVLITNRIGFATQQTNGFRGFDVYNGNSATSYVDNVTVAWWDRFKVNGVLDHLISSVNGIVPDRIIGLPAP